MSEDFLNARVGDQLPPLRLGPVTRAMLALYAGASGDHNPVHIDIDHARNNGFDDVFVHGLFAMAQLGRMVTDWAGVHRLRNLSTRFKAITRVHDEIICSGEVIERIDRAGESLLRVKLHAHVQSGIQILAGEATIRIS